MSKRLIRDGLDIAQLRGGILSFVARNLSSHKLQTLDLSSAPFGYIPNNSSDQHLTTGGQGTETDLHGEFTAITAPTEQLETGTHRARMRIRVVLRAMPHMLLMETRRH